MTSHKYNSLDNTTLALWGITAFALLFWAYSQVQLGTNTNITWLEIAARRFLEGGTAENNFYETNPPLSLLVYIPLVGLQTLPFISLHTGILIYGILLCLLSAGALAWILRHIPGLHTTTKHIFLLSYIFAVTLLPGYYFADREHLMMLGLMPMAVYLYGLTVRGMPDNAMPALARFIVLGISGIFILIKPQFLLIPALFFIARLRQTGSARCILETPFLILGLVTILYFGLTYLVFPTYIHTILPDVLEFYIGYIAERNVTPIALALGVILFLIALAALSTRPRDPSLIWALIAGGLAGILSFVVQNKGFYYHILPVFIFLVPAMALILQSFLESLKSAHQQTAIITVSIALLLTAGFHKDFFSRALYPAYYTPADTLESRTWPGHDDVNTSELVELVREHAANGSYYMAASMPMAITPAAYTTAEYASRFPAVWFLPYLVNAAATDSLPEKEIQAHQKRYVKMVAEDFAKYKPDLVIIGDFVYSPNQSADFSYINWLKAAPEFSKQWQNYEKLERLELFSANYYRGFQYGNRRISNAYDIYVRK